MKLNPEKMDFNFLMKHQKNITENLAKKNKEVIEYDFKIISFKIGEEFYGIDILYVKEIFKDNKFTNVPNTLDFVLGVYNLRGEIIPIIDLSMMFHIKHDESKIDGNLKSIIVIKVENLLIGVIVEEIYRVIPLRKQEIQPPSPLLGKINEKFISGVANVDNKLCVIFDTDAIFSEKEINKKEVIQQQTSDLSEDFFIYFCNQFEQLTGCFINEFNRVAFRKFYNEFIEENKIKDMPAINKEIAEKYINKFYSFHTNEFWKEPYVNHFKDVVVNELNKFCSEEVKVYNAGCGNGYETFSILFLLLNYFPDADVDVIAADSNLTSISNATKFEISKNDFPNWINIDQYFMKINQDTYKIKKEFNDKIYFEFHDIKNLMSKKQEFDIIIARDFSIFLSEDNYKKFLDNAADKLVQNGVLVIGDKEEILKHPMFTKVQNKNISCYIKK